MGLIEIERIVRWGIILLQSELLRRWVQRGNIILAPYFAGYLAVSIIDLAWNPQRSTLAIYIIPWQLSFLFCALIEAVRLCFPPRKHEARRIFILLMLSLGLLSVSVLGVNGYLLSGAFYRAVRQYFHVGLASAALVGIISCVCDGVYPPRAPRSHYLLLSAHILVLAGMGFLPRPGSLESFLETRIWFLVSVGLCSLGWLRLKRLLSF